MPDVVNTYLVFNGNCAEAMKFYEKALGGKLATLLTHSDSPVADQVPREQLDRVMHARLDLNGGFLMASDEMVGQPYPGMSGFSVSLIYSSADEAKRVFNKLAEGGKVTMPLQRTFWAEAFGMVTDRFGTPWMVNGSMIPVDQRGN